jgi:hypothetical protein
MKLIDKLIHIYIDSIYNFVRENKCIVYYEIILNNI